MIGNHFNYFNENCKLPFDSVDILDIYFICLLIIKSYSNSIFKIMKIYVKLKFDIATLVGLISFY